MKRHLLHSVVVSLLFMVGLGLGFGQQVQRYTNFEKNLPAYNPAASGMMRSVTNVSLVTRAQWLDFEGAPVTVALWGDHLFQAHDMAVGANVVQDRIGPYRQTEVTGNFAYQLHLTSQWKLSLGVRAGVAFAGYDASQFTSFSTQSDPLELDDGAFQAALPKFGLGGHLQHKKYYIGLSIPDLLVLDKQDVLENGNASFFSERRNWLGMAGYKHTINDQYEIHPNILVAYYPLTGLKVEANALVEIKGFSWLGLGGSTQRNFSLLAGVYLSSRINLGYAVDIQVDSTIPQQAVVHEININVDLDGLVGKTL